MSWRLKTLYCMFRLYMGTLLIVSSLSLTLVSWLLWAKALSTARCYEKEQASLRRLPPSH